MGMMWIVGAIAGWFVAGWVIGPALGLMKGAFQLGGGDPALFESNRAAYYGGRYR